MIAVESGPYRATVNPHGGGLARLSHDGRDLLVPQDGKGAAPHFRGAVLAPWPNRIHDGVYDFDGRTHALPINEPERNTALHGLVFDLPWQVTEQQPDGVTLTVDIEPQDGYPYSVRLAVSYRLGSDGLGVRLSATNAGDRPAPYGCGFHPYLASGPQPVDDLVLRIDAERRLAVTPKTLRPVGLEEIGGGAYDFRDGRKLGGMALDDAYAEVGRVAIADAVGEVELWRDDGLPWLQAFTPPGRGAIALEPCSCPADAFVSGRDLVVLEPGRSYEVGWGIRTKPA